MKLNADGKKNTESMDNRICCGLKSRHLRISLAQAVGSVEIFRFLKSFSWLLLKDKLKEVPSQKTSQNRSSQKKKTPSPSSGALRLHPSPAVTARADDLIGDCIEKMNRQNSGALLILSANHEEELIGIFTVYDLLQHIGLIQEGKYWNRAIRTIMTSPVRTLEAKDIGKAPFLMKRHGFRHLPVVVKSGAKNQLMGVLHMRDLFYDYVRKEEIQAELQKGTKPLDASAEVHSVGILSSHALFCRSLRFALDHAKGLEGKRLPVKVFESPARLWDYAHDHQTLIIDIDGHHSPEWAQVVRAANAMKPRPHLILVFTPSEHTEQTMKALRAIQGNRAVEVFERPLDFYRIVMTVRQWAS